jgi:hypothetical protein
MQMAKSKKIVVTDLGLKDGIIHSQYLKVKDQIPNYHSPN